MLFVEIRVSCGGTHMYEDDDAILILRHVNIRSSTRIKSSLYLDARSYVCRYVLQRYTIVRHRIISDLNYSMMADGINQRHLRQLLVLC